MSDAGFPLPPPTFEFLVFSLKTQAEMRLGLLSFGSRDGKEGEPDLPSARHAIDMLAMLQEKTRGNLSIEEQRLIENSLTELRKPPRRPKGRKRFPQNPNPNQREAPGLPPTNRRERGDPNHGARLGDEFWRADHRLLLRRLPLARSSRPAAAPVDSDSLRGTQRDRGHDAGFPGAGAAHGPPASGRDHLHARARRPYPGARRRAAVQLPAEIADAAVCDAGNAGGDPARVSIRLQR